MEIIKENIGRRIREALDKANVLHQDLAALLNVTQPTVSAWVTGRNEPPLKALAMISQLCAVSIEWLVTGNELESTIDAVAETREPYQAIDAVDLAFLKDWKSLSEVERMRIWTTLKEAKEQNKVHGGGLREVS